MTTDRHLMNKRSSMKPAADKRQQAGSSGGGGSGNSSGGGSSSATSHVVRGASSATSRSAVASSTTTTTTAAAAAASIIAPPPRVAVPSSAAKADDDVPGDGTANGAGAGPSGGSSSGAGVGSAANGLREGGGSSGRGGRDGSGSSPSSSGSVAGSTSRGGSSSSSNSSAATTALLLREKDARINQLERELSTMETEFQRELDKLSANESETAVFWQAKHSALHQQFLRADTELRLLRNEVDVREAERAELRDGWERLRRDVADREREVAELRGQVRGLKEWVSTSTRAEGQTSDEVFGEGMARLGNGLQNWVIVHFRRTKLDPAKLPAAVKTELDSLVPMYEELAHKAKIHLLQSVVSRILVDMVFGAYFFGLSSEQTQQFVQMEQLLASFGPTAAVNQWRSSTLGLLRREAPQKMAAETSAATDEVVRRVNRLLDALASGSGGGGSSSETRDQALRALVASAVELSRQLAAQKAVFRVIMPDVLPHQRVLFDGATMEDVGGEEDDDGLLARREIWCVTFPGVVKSGDENGGHPQYRNVIAKARVLCSPE